MSDNKKEKDQKEIFTPDNEELCRILLTLYLNSDIGIKVVDKDFKIKAINKKALEYLDIKEKNVIGKSCNIGCNFASSCNFPGRKAVEQQIVVNCSVEKKLSDGEILPLYIKAVPLKDSSGSPDGFIEIIENFKTKHQAELDRDRFFNLSPYIIGIVNEEGIVTRVNSAIEKVLGWKPEEICGETFQKIIHPDDFEDTKQHISKLIRDNGILYGFENRYIAKDGTCRHFSWDAFYLKDYKQLFTIGRDITDTKKIQTQFLQAQKMESIGRLAGGIAHDFNNMLSAIIGSAQMLEHNLNSNSDEDTVEFVKIIMEAAQNASELTKRLLSFSRKGNYVNVPINVNELVEQVITLFSHTLPPDITVVKKLTDLELIIKGDPSSLQNALFNLALNAKDAIREEGTITFSTSFVSSSDLPACPDLEVTTDCAAISITDTGTGISEEDSKNIFEPFFTTKQKGQGTGLGLSAVLGTVQLHKGYILFNSSLGKGSTFTVYLPLDKGSEVPKHKKHKSVPDLQGLKILLVDDEPIIRTITKAMLENLNCKVTTAADGLEALEIFRQSNDFDIAVIDMLMPNMSGDELALKIMELNPETKILLISAFCVKDKTAPVLAKEGTAFLNKPFNMQELTEALTSL
jgi:PAS domain S-box-containing protein